MTNMPMINKHLVQSRQCKNIRALLVKHKIIVSRESTLPWKYQPRSIKQDTPPFKIPRWTFALLVSFLILFLANNYQYHWKLWSPSSSADDIVWASLKKEFEQERREENRRRMVMKPKKKKLVQQKKTSTRMW